ncbi:MAG: hypothetical protein JNM56_04860 [Planctomycetia bacterium]|nr:hypothetical protein [Planctomycetia bacterium]
MPSLAANPELQNHFSVVIYPFVHPITGSARSARLAALGERWVPWWTRLSDDGLTDALRATGFFLPYVRGLLYPEVAVLQGEAPGPQYRRWAECLRHWTNSGLEQFCGHLPSAAILRLTLREPYFQSLAEFSVQWEQRAPGAPARQVAGCLDWIDALLFPSGVGFLLLKFGLRAAQPRLAQFIELNQAMQVVHAPSTSRRTPRLTFDAGGPPSSLRELLNHLTQGLVGGHGAEPWDGQFHPLGIVPARTPYTDSEAGVAYGERCHLLSYACADLADRSRSALPAGVFASGEERMLFEYAAGIGLNQTVEDPMWVPSPEQAERIRRENRLAMWRCWQALALKESCVFLGTEALPFTTRSLPHTIEHDYLPLYLYTLHQKFQLMIFANDLMREVAQVDSHLQGARSLLHRFVAFRNRFWFSEVTRKPQGGELYRLMQQSMDVPGLYQMALASVKDAKEYYEERWDRQVRLGLTLIGLGGPAAALVGAMQAYLNDPYLVAAAASACALLTSSLIWFLDRKQTQSRRRPLRRIREPRRLSLASSRRRPHAKAG